jgi:pyruvate-formate lyase-activating enzyme
LHLVELLARRTVPAAGVSIGLTRRCPLSCAHCATNSTTSSEEIAADVLLRFVGTFGHDDPPEVLAMSGGEPLLRPRLVRELAERAHDVGCRSTVLSGLFFARSGRIPPAIRAAIDEVDHFSVSLDVFHEREVPRANVLRVLEAVLARGTDVSIHVVGLDADDPYLEDVTSEVRRVFDDRVPMFVNTVSAFGRAQAWHTDAPRVAPSAFDADPCMLAAWPLVGWDGTITACGNEDVVDGPVPSHLRLGHAGADDWPTVQARARTSSIIRAIRLFGPEYLADRLQDEPLVSDGYCSTCMRLPDDPRLLARVREMMQRPALAPLEAVAATLQQRAGAVAFARRCGAARYAELTTLGAPA